MLQRSALVFFAAVVTLPTLAQAAVFSAGGDNTPASIQATVDAFRAALGNPNGNQGPQPSGRREINWDGGGPPVDATTPAATPFEVFLNTRGAQFTSAPPGLTQAPPSGGPQNGLAAINSTYGTIFSTFSPNRLFAPVASNITDGFFFLPGSGGATPATVSGFGAVFTDVDLANTTKIEFFDAANNPVLTQFAPPGTVSDGSLSFLGVTFDPGVGISHVRITTGNAALGPNDGGGVDVVVMDDVLYSEPVPEPSTLALLGIGVAGLIGISRYRKTARRSA